MGEAPIQNPVLRVIWKKKLKLFPMGSFFLYVVHETYIPRNLPCPEKFLTPSIVSSCEICEIFKNTNVMSKSPVYLYKIK